MSWKSYYSCNCTVEEFVFWDFVCFVGFFFCVCFSKFPRTNINFAPVISILDFLPCTKEIAPDLTPKSFMDYISDEHKYAEEQWSLQ